MDQNYVNPGNHIVITRIEGCIGGSLFIPATINDMQVIAIGKDALNLSQQSQIFISPGIKNIAANAIRYQAPLKILFSDDIYIHPSAFSFILPTDMLSFVCPADCTNRKGETYVDIGERDYGATVTISSS